MVAAARPVWHHNAMLRVFLQQRWWLVVAFLVMGVLAPGNVRSLWTVRCLLGPDPAGCAPSIPPWPGRLRLALAAQTPDPDAADLARDAGETASDPITSYWLGVIAWQQGNADTARSFWRQSGFLSQRVTYLLRTGWKDGLSPAERESAFKQAIELDPTAGPAYTALATVYWGTDWDAASLALDNAITYLPEGTAEWYWNVGRRALIKGDWPNAVAALEQSVRLQPSEWNERFLAQAYHNNGQADKGDALDRSIQARYGS